MGSVPLIMDLGSILLYISYPASTYAMYGNTSANEMEPFLGKSKQPAALAEHYSDENICQARREARLTLRTLYERRPLSARQHSSMHMCLVPLFSLSTSIVYKAKLEAEYSY